MPSLPQRLSTRPLATSDLDAAFHVYAEDEFRTTGQRVVEREDLESDWSRPSLDLSTDTIGVFEENRLVAAA